MTRPVFHFTSKRNWINDPNGLIYYKGYYHKCFTNIFPMNQCGDNAFGGIVQVKI